MTILLNGKALYTTGFNFSETFQLQLSDNQIFYAKKILRHLPKKRMTVYGEWSQQTVVAKIFFHPRKAEGDAQKELAGIHILQENKIPSPTLLYQGKGIDNIFYILIFEYIETENLKEKWEGALHEHTLKPLFKNIMVEIATQHVLGVTQQDLHLENFLMTPRKIYTVDGAQICSFPMLLPKKQSILNLALFLSQLGAGVKKFQDQLFRHYAASRGWILKKTDLIFLHQMIKKRNEMRWQNFSKKIFRNSTHFSKIKNIRLKGMYQTAVKGNDFIEFFKDPEAIFKDPATLFLKSGRSATVVKICLDGKPYVVKRYNIKNIGHFLSRALRRTRAENSWRIAQKLHLFGVATAKPIAYLERRFLGVRQRSYYITEFISGEHAGTYFEKNGSTNDKSPALIQSIAHLLKSVLQLDIIHGDLKITNILLDASGKPYLIDLDGAYEQTSLSSLRHAWRKEVRRFLKNFNNQPELQNKFLIELDQQDLL